jgi:hypothetical protein
MESDKEYHILRVRGFFYTDCTEKYSVLNLPDSVLPTVLTDVLSWQYPVPFDRLCLLISCPEGIQFCSTDCAVSYSFLHVSGSIVPTALTALPLVLQVNAREVLWSIQQPLVAHIVSFISLNHSAISSTVDRASLNNLRIKQAEWRFLMFFVSSFLLISFFSFFWLYFSAWVYFPYDSALVVCILAFVPFGDVHILAYSLLLLYFLFCFLLCTSLLIWRYWCVLLEVLFIGERSTSYKGVGISVEHVGSLTLATHKERAVLK